MRKLILASLLLIELSIIYMFYLIVTGSGTSKVSAREVLIFSVVAFAITAWLLFFRTPTKSQKLNEKRSFNTGGKPFTADSLISGLIKEFDYVLADLIDGKTSNFSYDDKKVISNYLEVETRCPVSFDGGGQSTTFKTKDKIIFVEIKESDTVVAFDEQPHYEVYANNMLVRDLTDVLIA